MSAAVSVTESAAPAGRGSGEPYDTVLLAALLAGLGPQAPRLATLAGRSGTAGESRTCIDAGSALMLSAATTSRRELGIHQRQRGPVLAADGREPRPDGELHWRETRCSGAAVTGHARTVLTAAAVTGSGQLDALLDQVDAAGRARFRRWHALLGPYGRLYSLRRPLVEGTGPAWVGWQLDRGRARTAVAQDPALAAAWVAAGEPLSTLFPASDASAAHAVLSAPGPWSVAVALDDPDTFRIGTSRWAWQPDDERKRRRLGQLAAAYGSPAFPQALLRLLSDRVADPTASRVPARQRVGRAVEVEVRGGVASQLEFFLAVPPGTGHHQHPHPNHHLNVKPNLNLNPNLNHGLNPREDGPS